MVYCDAQNAEHIVVISVLMQSLLKFWSSADDCGHLIVSPDGLLVTGKNVCV
jgi:hypothetical protein